MPDVDARTRTREATGLAIRELRAARGLSQLELGKQVHLSQAQIARIETATGGCTVEKLAELARALRVTRLSLFEAIEAARKVLQAPNARRAFLAGRTRRTRGGD